MLENWIKQLGQELDITDLITQTEPLHYVIPLNNYQIRAIPSNQSYLLKGEIGNCPEQNTESFLLKLMEANLFGRGTRGSIIGLNESGKLLTLTYQLDYNRSYKEFKEKLEDFISVLDFWKQEILKHY
jgi:Tir chaperone protein (CesT) family